MASAKVYSYEIAWALTVSCLLLLGACSFSETRALSASIFTQPTETEYHDNANDRRIPVLMYGMESSTQSKPLAIISHGYGGTMGDYSFIANDLVQRGYVVAAIQHELPGDAPLPVSGNLREARIPNWQIGSSSIGFVISKLQQDGIADAQAGTLLVGHSNGGDMAALFANQHPEMISALYSLDHRRMPVPRSTSPRVCSIRSSDQLADEEVFPSIAEQERLNMLLVQGVDLPHNDMWDGATNAQKSQMLSVLDSCLSDASTP